MDNKGPVVYVTQETNHNFTKAERYGEVVFLTSQEFSRSSNSKRNDTIIQGMKSILDKFRPDIDYLLPSGSPVAIGATFLIVGSGFANFPLKIQILQWDNREYDYYPVELTDIFD